MQKIHDLYVYFVRLQIKNKYPWQWPFHSTIDIKTKSHIYEASISKGVEAIIGLHQFRVVYEYYVVSRCIKMLKAVMSIVVVQ